MGFSESPPRQPRRLAQPRRNQRGQGMLEYALVLGLIALVVIGILGIVGKKANSAFCQVATGLNGNSGGCNVQAWGSNGWGELGNGTESGVFSTAPVSVPVSGFSLVAKSHGDHTLALKSDGSLWGWGRNTWGTVGVGTSGASTDVLSPTQIIGISKVIAVAGGYQDSLALKSDGTVWQWGDNAFGELGNGTTCVPAPSYCVGATSPTMIASLSGITKLWAGYSFNFALKSDGTLWAWGDNTYGELGDGTAVTPRTTPEQITLPAFTNLALGKDFSLALKTDGTIIAWGYGTYGNLGNGLGVASSTPVAVSNLTNVTVINAGLDTGIAVKSDGTVWTWGTSGFGELGNGTTCAPQLGCAGSLVPVQATGLTNVTAVDSGRDYEIALKSDGTVWTWGDNQWGQLCDGTPLERDTPVRTVGLSNVKAIATGYVHGVALSPS
jgi:alpha-tubulin suppressor-like RCC1 family protein/Flp pilus assembly pilin Flp